MRYAQGGGGPLGARKYDIVQLTRGKVLEIGRGPFKVWPHFLALRERGDTSMGDVKADLTCDSFEAAMSGFNDGAFDAVVVHSGVDAPLDVSRVLREGGKYIWVDQGAQFTHLVVETKVDGIVRLVPQPKPEGKTACVVRYGAIGDSIQTAALLPELKRQGYHVTFMCEPIGEVLLRHDPHIDEFMVQDKDQVPNTELGSYFRHHQGKFDRFINLCESVEGTLLPLPGRAAHAWPKALRHELCDKNYGEFMAKIADLPFNAEHHFYETHQERERAADLISQIGKQQNPDWIMGQKWQRPFVIMWILAGSAVHKVYPHQDSVIAAIMTEIPHAHVITTGDDACRILEAGWENEKRVHTRSGEMPIRDTIALAKQCDLVIGPETGVMNAVAYEDMAKILLLSHSTAENLTKHWVNTEAIATEDTPCYPCHQLHYGWSSCSKHESGTAQCQWDIAPARVWQAVQRAFVASATVRKLLETA
jgi:ADP-heptose:LPS heptosyltransferase